MRVLVVGLNWIGDVIMSFPAISFLTSVKEHFVEVLTRPHLTELYKLLPNLKFIRPINTKRAFWLDLQKYARLRRNEYDLIYVFPRSFRSAFCAFLCGGKKRIGYENNLRNFFLTDVKKLPYDFEKRHESSLYLELIQKTLMLKSNGCNLDKDFHQKFLQNLNLPSNQLFTNFWEKLGMAPPANYVVLSPGAAFGPAKRWPVQKFSELADRITKELGLSVIVTGSLSEAYLTREVASKCSTGAIDLGGKTSILELISLLIQSRVVVTNDSGTMHLAALVEKPLIVLVGSTDMRRTGPLHPNPVIIKGKGCSPPCRKPFCVRGNDFCMNAISVESVFQALIRVV